MTKKLLGVLTPIAAVAATLLPVSPAAASGDSVINPPGHYGLATWVSAPRCLVVLANGSRGSLATLTQCGNYDDQSWSVPAANTTGEIRNKFFGSNGCLTVQTNNPGAQAFVYTCTGLADQQWSAIPVPGGNGSVWYQKAGTTQCLVVQGNTEGAVAMQYDCGYYKDQYWQA
ncbi:RICIN domain-containing protein [Kitasatospora sp. NPDC057692]|uniref:RICIN domain-containing protein n=1 Tax=Kitasatospora sp. NPDC057692 TaxID=3346215 RepID=UPI0036742D6D